MLLPGQLAEVGVLEAVVPELAKKNVRFILLICTITIAHDQELYSPGYC